MKSRQAMLGLVMATTVASARADELFYDEELAITPEPDFVPHMLLSAKRAKPDCALTDRDRERIAAAQAKRERKAKKRLQMMEPMPSNDEKR